MLAYPPADQLLMDPRPVDVHERDVLPDPGRDVADKIDGRHHLPGKMPRSLLERTRTARGPMARDGSLPISPPLFEADLRVGSEEPTNEGRLELELIGFSGDARNEEQDLGGPGTVHIGPGRLASMARWDAGADRTRFKDEAVLFHERPIGKHGGFRGTAKYLAGLDVEHGAMPGTLDTVTVQLAFVERTSLVRAIRADREERAPEIEHDHRLAFRVHPDPLSLRRRNEPWDHDPALTGSLHTPRMEARLMRLPTPGQRGEAGTAGRWRTMPG